jgi:hypothetical protein
MSNNIPGLKSIEETPDGFIFDIEDGKEEEFFSAFGLQVGDKEGLQKVLESAIQMLIDQKRGELCEKS